MSEYYDNGQYEQYNENYEYEEEYENESEEYYDGYSSEYSDNSNYSDNNSYTSNQGYSETSYNSYPSRSISFGKVLGFAILIFAIIFFVIGKFGIPVPSIPPVTAFSGNILGPGEVIGSENVRISYYDPNLGGINCYHDPVTGVCAGLMANGQHFNSWYNRGAACPPDRDIFGREYPQWKFGSKFRLPDGSVWTCTDRGGKIQYEDGVAWVDLLMDHPPSYVGQIVKAEFIK